ncbi:hypothetical protein ACR79M_14605 [Sphingobacterium spiritivorum]|uniref:hypothetical protein n=1 Tax=Sphingobacterium spiritivorum TaxID=258 RepID=UPI00191A8884|nr:hypothetical protein [Sphingobacterium spiritivorum]QQT27066.1 hypothetical protein I6J02_04175 [Sphingobacterium spiritivorum]
MDSYLEELMQREDIHRITDEAGNQYGIRVLGRGENLLFIENERGLICTIDAEHAAIFTRSVKKWDSSGQNMSKKERTRVVSLIEQYYRKFYSPNVILIDDY